MIEDDDPIFDEFEDNPNNLIGKRLDFVVEVGLVNKEGSVAFWKMH